LRAADRVTIDGGRITTSAAAPKPRQIYGIALYQGLMNDASEKVRILDVHASEGLTKAVEALDLSGIRDPDAAATSGYYRIQSTGNPEGRLAAPVASQYVDLLTGAAYRKVFSSGPCGWRISDG
jgi:hypothetical protein